MTHLNSADGLIIFIDGTAKSVISVVEVLKEFEREYNLVY